MHNLPNLKRAIEKEEATVASLVNELACELAKPVNESDALHINQTRRNANGVFLRLQRHLGEFDRTSQFQRISADTKNDGAPANDFFQTNQLFEAVRYRTMLWFRLAALIDAQAAGQREEPIQLPVPKHAAQIQAMQALHEMYRAFHRLANSNAQSEDAVGKNYYADIPLPATEFVAYAQAAHRLCLAQRRTRPFSFLDVGCGGGTKVMMASSYFERTDGLEYDSGYAESGRTAVEKAGAKTSQIFTGDALTFENYADYDVIYFYRPIADQELRYQMENRISKLARPGTILVAPFYSLDEPRDGLDVAHLVGPIFVTRTDEKTAAELVRAAELIGFGVPRIGVAPDPRCGYLQTLTDACAAKGYVL